MQVSEKYEFATINECLAHLIFLVPTKNVEREFNHSFIEQKYAHELKKTKEIQSYKKLDVLKTVNYRSIAASILPQVSKNYERIIYKKQCCIWKKYSQAI